MSLAAGQLEEDSQSLVQPLVGENPVYMDRARGSHTDQLTRTQDYHQFANPLYNIHRGAPPQRSRTESPAYAYPSNSAHLVSSVYLPGDSSPQNGSLLASTGQPADSEGPHYEQQSQVQRSEPSSASHRIESQVQRSEPSSASHRIESQVQGSSASHRIESQYSYVQRVSTPPSESSEERDDSPSLSSQYFHLPLDT